MGNNMYYFIVNTASGSGKGADVWKRISSVLKERNVTYKAYKTGYAGHAKELATKISSLNVEELKLIVVHCRAACGWCRKWRIPWGIRR